MEVITSYTQRTLAAYMSEEELTKLCEQITRYLSSEWSIETSQDIKVSSISKYWSMHFGWIISRPFGKKREDIAFFLKHTFAHTLRDVEVSSIQRKLTNTEGKYLISLCKDLVIDEHSTPLESYPKVTWRCCSAPREHRFSLLANNQKPAGNLHKFICEHGQKKLHSTSYPKR